jgi:methylphosphotriester-DNA--protein-cysteine methyltransferase
MNLESHEATAVPTDATDESRRARPGQRQRTRKDLLQAASRLLKEGRRPSLDEVAEAASVSRATAYRYFPGMEALLLEASLESPFPKPTPSWRASATTP